MNQINEAVATATQPINIDLIANIEAIGQNQQVDRSGALREILEELVRAEGVGCMHGVWVRRCYADDKEQPVRCIQNNLRILTRRAKHHLQRAKALADHIGEQNNYFRKLIEYAETDLNILAEPYQKLDDIKVVGLITVADDFVSNIKSAANVASRMLEACKADAESEQTHFDHDAVDYKSVEQIPDTDFEMVSKLDYAYSIIESICDYIAKHGMSDQKSCTHTIEKMLDLLSEYQNCQDEYQAESITDAVNYLNFLDKVFKANVEIQDSDRWALHCILDDVTRCIRMAADSANKEQARQVLSVGEKINETSRY